MEWQLATTQRKTLWSVAGDHREILADDEGGAGRSLQNHSSDQHAAMPVFQSIRTELSGVP
jgi:hypothetical protein